jgi:hypothetical protein
MLVNLALTPGAAFVQPAPTTHEVLSIGGMNDASKKGKVTLSLYMYSPHLSSNPLSL